MQTLKKEKEELKKVRDAESDKIKALEDGVRVPREKIKSLKNDKEVLGRELEHFKLESLNAEIRSIQEKLGFSSLTVTDEKRLIERKSKLESQKPKVERYVQTVTQLKTLHDSNDKVFKELKTLKDSRNAKTERLNKVVDKMNSLYTTQKENDPKVKILEEQIKNIREEINKCHDKKRELDDEYYDKLNRWRDQQRLLKYIKDATEVIEKIKKREEREKKRKEREAKMAAESEKETLPENSASQQQEEDLFAYEIATCEWLVNYFNNVLGVKQGGQNPITNSTDAKQLNVNSKIDEDISKGLIKPLTRQEDEFSIGLSTSTAPKKKTKGPKISKREQKAESSNLFTLDISIIKKIQDVQLAPPSKKSDLPNFVAQLQQNIQGFRQKAEERRQVANVTNTQTPNQEASAQSQISSKTEQATPQVEKPVSQARPEEDEEEV